MASHTERIARRLRHERALLTGPIAAHQLWRRVRARVYARLAAMELPEVATGVTIDPSVQLLGTRRIHIGETTGIGPGARLNTSGDGRIVLGRDVWVGASCVLNASRTLHVGDGALLADNCFLSTHRHAFEGEGPISAQGATGFGDITIGPGAWLASNVVLTPGVTIGAGAVVGANSVVTRDVPPRSVAAGAPARILRSF